jgi:predicted DNA-binding protein (UPF0251 family)
VLQTHNAYNPYQVFQIVKDKLKKDETGFCSYLDEQGTKIKLDDFVKDFLNNPQNDNLVQSDRKAGTFHSKTSAKSKTMYNKKDVIEAQEKGLKIDDFLTIKRLRDEKLLKRRDKIMHCRKYFRKYLGDTEMPWFTIALTNRQRELFRIYYLQGQSRNEVAQQLGISTKTVDASLLQARKRIDRFLLEKGVETYAATVN